MYKIEFPYKEDSDFVKILKLIENYAWMLNWYIYEINAISKEGSDILAGDLSKKALNSSCGVKVDWSELKRIGNGLLQVVDGVFIGTEKNYNEITIEQVVSNDSPFQLLIECKDTFSWSISSSNIEVIQIIKNNFQKWS